MKKNEKKQKLGIKKFQIAKINNLKHIVGGNANNNTNDDDDLRTGTISG